MANPSQDKIALEFPELRIAAVKQQLLQLLTAAMTPAMFSQILEEKFTRYNASVQQQCVNACESQKYDPSSEPYKDTHIHRNKVSIEQSLWLGV
jgi:hypothetical protein